MNLENMSDDIMQSFDKLEITFNDADGIFSTEDGKKGINFG